MRKIALISLLSNLSLFATEKLNADDSMPWLLPWLLSSLLLIGVLFWSMYKAMKTKNPKYGYVIFLSIILMAVLSFI